MAAAHVAAAPRFSFERGVPETATFGPRFLAFALDSVLVYLAAFFVTGAAVSFGLIPAPDLRQPIDEIAADPFNLLFILVEGTLAFAYMVVCEAVSGRTIGKLALGLRVVDAEGGRLRLGQAATRNLLRFLWFVPFFFFAFVVIDWYLMHVGEMDQRIGDLVAKTYVVRDGAWWPPR